MAVDEKTIARIERALSELTGTFGNGLRLTWKQLPTGKYVFGAIPQTEKGRTAVREIKKLGAGVYTDVHTTEKGEDFYAFVNADTIEDVADVLFGMGLLAQMMDRGFVDKRFMEF